MNGNPFGKVFGGDWLRFQSQESSSKIFISYRREDTRGDAGRLTDKLKFHFGEKQIFRDVEAIEAGVDFVEAINDAVGACTALIAVIGPNWLKITDEQGRRRLDDPHDFVRLEIAAALTRRIRVIPVLVGGASMPKAGEIPADLESFARRQSQELSDQRWDYDVGHLIETLEKLGIKRHVRPAPDKTFWTRGKIVGALAVGLLLIAGIFYSRHEANIDYSRTNPFPQIPINSGVIGNSDQPMQTGPEPGPVASGPSGAVAPPVSRRPNVSYAGFDAIGRQPAIVQVYDPT